MQRCFREILGEEHVIEHHSGASFDSDAEMNGAESLQRLAAENWDGPVVVTTAVQFFESLYSNRRPSAGSSTTLPTVLLCLTRCKCFPLST